MSASIIPPSLRPFFALSYPVATPANPDAFPDSQFYGIGPRDGLFVLGWSIIFTLLRELTMKSFRPIARYRFQALASRKSDKKETGAKLAKQAAAREKKVGRFGEQGWSFVYYTVAWFAGMVRASPSCSPAL